MTNCLKKCLHESGNGVIWKKCPKYIYVGRSTLEIGVNSPVISYNFGASRLLYVLKEYGLQYALYTNTFCRKKEISRIKESCWKERERERNGND